MRTVYLIPTLASVALMLGGCGEAEQSFSTLTEQSRATMAIEGPVAIPLLPSISSDLIAGQILCDSYQLGSGDGPEDEDGDEDHDSEKPAMAGKSQCEKTANRLYQEIQVQLTLLKSPSTVSRGLAAISDKTTVLFPDGSYTQGASAYAASYPRLFDSQPVAAIQNRFIYKPISKDTVIVIGNPAYTLAGGATVDSVQYQVYTRSHGGSGPCRSLSHLAGRVCWSQVAAEWVYAQPFSGTSLPHSTSPVRSQIPAAASYPVALEPERIICDGAFRARPGDPRSCEQTAREFYKEIEFQVLTLTDPSTVTSGLAALNAATTFVYPTGLVTEGLTALGVYTPSLFGVNWFPVGLENKFLYKALDPDTVLFFGDPAFTMFNFATGELRTTESVQLSLYRRNSTSLGNCRSAVNPTGDVCWTEIAEQWVYGQPVRGG